MAIIEDELDPGARVSDLKRLAARIESKGGPVLVLARKLAQQLHTTGRRSVAEEIDLVSSALENLLSLSHETVQDPSVGMST